MDIAAIVMLLGSLGVFAIFAGLFIWGLRTGQFKNIEEPKYKILGNIYKNDDGKGEGDDHNA